MSEKKPQLGRGLSALLGSAKPVTAAVSGAAAPAAALDRDTSSAADAPRPGPGARQLSLSLLHPNPLQPRQDFDEAALDALTQSIRAQGVLQPILVRPHPRRPSEFQIVAGERRWRAAQRVPLHQVPVVVRDFDDKAMMEAAIVENVQRQDLNPIEEAEAYRRLKDDFGYTQEDLAEALGKSRSVIANALRLLNLPQKARDYLRHGQISAGHARAILGARDPDQLAEMIVSEGLSVRDAEALAAGRTERTAKGGKKPAKTTADSPARGKDADTRKLERELTLSLGLTVSIDFDGKGGAVTIAYRDLEQLNGLLARLRRDH